MTESEDYVAGTLKTWIWSGFYSPFDVEEMMEDILDENCDAAMLAATIQPEFERKAAAEHSWPATTDCDRLDAVFGQLQQDGICALANTGMTMSDGFSDVAEWVAQALPGRYTGFCFYHGQDVERAVQGHAVMLAFGSLAQAEPDHLGVGRAVVEALTRGGLAVAWNGSVDERIHLPGFDWKRRFLPSD